MKPRETCDGFAMHHKPTLRERLWRKIGFRYVRNDLPNGIEASHPGWILTTVVMGFSFWDRMRLLVSGKLHIDIRQATTHEVDGSINAVSYEIKPPF